MKQSAAALRPLGPQFQLGIHELSICKTDLIARFKTKHPAIDSAESFARHKARLQVFEPLTSDIGSAVRGGKGKGIKMVAHGKRTLPTPVATELLPIPETVANRFFLRHQCADGVNTDNNRDSFFYVLNCRRTTYLRASTMVLMLCRIMPS